MNMEQLMKSAKRLDTVFKVLQKVVVVCVIVIICVLGATAIVNAVNPDTIIGTELNVLEIGPLAVELNEEYTPDNGEILGYAWFYAAVGILCAAVMYVALRVVRSILQPMMEGRPFHADTAKSIKKLAVLSLVLGGIQNAANAFEPMVVLRTFGLEGLADSGVIRSVNVNYTFDTTFIIIFLVLLLISHIFAYGAQLQRLSDETL